MADSTATCKLISDSDTYTGKQALDYETGISKQSAGAEAICMHRLVIPPGGKGKAHLHEGHETAIYVLSGEAGMWYGENLEHDMRAKAGDYVYIPAGMPHLPYNVSDTEAVVAVLARTDPNEQESIELRPDLDNVHHQS